MPALPRAHQPRPPLACAVEASAQGSAAGAGAIPMPVVPVPMMVTRTVSTRATASSPLATMKPIVTTPAPLAPLQLLSFLVLVLTGLPVRLPPWDGRLQAHQAVLSRQQGHLCTRAGVCMGVAASTTLLAQRRLLPLPLLLDPAAGAQTAFRPSDRAPL